MGHKDANQSVKATWLGSADAHTSQLRPLGLGSADAPEGCNPALDKEARRWLPKSSPVS